MCEDWFELPPGTPENLKELIDAGSDGWKIRWGYSLQLKHGLMGYFPALYAGTDQVVASLDKAVIEEVWRSLSPRSSKLDVSLFYVNEQTGVGYAIEGVEDYFLRRSVPFRFLTRERLDEMKKAQGEKLFRWAPGLIGNDMTKEEFAETLQAALRNPQ